MGKMQRTKGSAYERFVANRLKELYPNAKRGLGQARSGGDAPDVQGTPMWIQTKHGKRPNLLEAIKQATRDMANSHDPAKYTGGVVVIARKDGERDVVMLYLDDYLTLLKEPKR